MSFDIQRAGESDWVQIEVAVEGPGDPREEYRSRRSFNLRATLFASSRVMVA
jgi:hypothetical protein